MRNIFVKEVENLMEYDEKIVFLSAECGFNVVESLQAKYPERFYNLGIAEQSLVGTAAGVSLRGLKPVAYTMAMFLSMRAYEQIRVDVAYQQLPVLLAGVIPGLGYGNSGPTHHSIEDAAILRVLPNITIVYPSCKTDVIAATRQLLELGKPSYIGLGRAPSDYQENYGVDNFIVGKALQIRKGKDVAVFTYGAMVPNVVKAAAILEKKGISTRIINMHTLKPLDTECIDLIMDECKILISVEEESIIGGLGGAMSEYLAEKSNKNYIFKRFGIPDTYGDVIGSQAYMHKMYQLDAESIARRIAVLCEEK